MPTIHHGDCIETMNQMPAESVDAIVTDPPYGLSFMSAKWDATPPGVQWAEACYRVLKPGGHIAAFGGTRTWHRLAVAIEDAGFEMRDSLAWLYGSGFPKSHDVGKAIDKLAGAEREVIGRTATPFKVDAAAHRGTSLQGSVNGDFSKQTDKDGYRYTEHTAPATPEAAQWDGWGTALKPAFEPIVLARKPLAEKTVARNVLAHGTGAINIDGCRVGMSDADREAAKVPQPTIRPGDKDSGHALGSGEGRNGATFEPAPAGRWPANVLLDHHAAEALDQQSGTTKGSGKQTVTARPRLESWRVTEGRGDRLGQVEAVDNYGDSGGASRFFYSAKAPRSERPNVDGVQHPTVKPLAIMRWLIRLVTPPGGTVLDPFAGSGTTIEAALIEGFEPVGIEMEAEYLPLIQHRIDRQAGTLTA